ncbi:dnaJ homolog subfamily C member 11 isoform X1 [Neodiprion pinetum]|uniref:dnaJ homolog subfamily C member 11 isoform X1 n=1 Tax=Neodiprion fabricii TaxID=2872261 RepID=UPI001ED8C773|nr:dnaJ homolog subfamily C member 11 isoform X1 [Neodiprion fabricii]XP_046479851.1 dnaJ homolog subfamily C member 11 isoform X1 [Neodiprion pinetum]XP_046617732.1 dnaJ homolog subfamily C member 11 isoform X1 [Neodiprion virginianus]
MDDDGDQDNVIEEDFYTFLNVPRNATAEEINNAYRRQSRLYHPDKHVDPVLKREAETLFTRTKKAYEVLSDAHQRAIYDSLGTRGLETEGWEIVQRAKTPQEIREEYERLAREREERRLQQRTNPKGNVTVNINATDIFNRYDDEYDDISDRIFPTIEVSGMSFSQSIEAPLTLRDTVTMSGQLGTQNGTGTGSVNVSARRLISSKGWLELDVGAGNGPMLSLKGFRTLTKRLFCNGATILQFTAHGIRPGLVGTLAMQLDKHAVGYLTYRAGIQSAMSTMIVRDTSMSHTSFTMQFGMVHSYISLSYTYKMEERQLKLRGCVKAGTFGAFLEYGAEKKVSQHSSLSASVSVGVPTGVILKIKLSRASQTYSFPIHLCEEVVPAPVFYATVVPLITWTVIKKLIIDPVVREQKERDKEKQKELNKTRMLEKQREAKSAIDLMKATFSRIRSEEEAKRGLVITKALYGRFVYPQERAPRDDDNGPRDEVIDVTIPLQCLVKDSKLVLHNASKSQLPGFYDPCVGEDKQLLLQYLFHAQTHECIIKDAEPLRIPKQSHRVNTT